MMNKAEITIIKASSNFLKTDFTELWKWRFLFYLMVKRNIKILYQNTFIGISWVVLQSLLTMIVFSALLSRIGGVQTNEVPYQLFTFGGILLWQGFSKSLIQASGSLIAHQSVITKVYFPRIIIPGSTVASVGIDLITNFAFYGVLFIYFCFLPKYTAPLGAFLLLFALIVSFFLSLTVSALSLKYRDLQLILPFLLQIGQFLTPIFYPLSLIPRPWQFVMAINPITSIVELMRWSLFTNYDFPEFSIILISFISFVILSIGGVYLFNKNNSVIAELL
jgi:lipopolysaccharide transport system permease protein